MQNLRVLFITGLLHLSTVDTLLTDAAFNSSDVNTRRWLVSDRYEGNWIAFGDSFSAGPGAGVEIVGSPCFRNEGAYSKQLQNDFPSVPNQLPHPFTFISCSGANIADATTSQLPAIQSSNTNYATLSIGSNDLFFAKILQSCIGGFVWSESCEALKTNARANLYSNDLFQAYRTLVRGAVDRSGWLNRAAPRRPLIFQTGYPTFFDSQTEICNNENFNFLTSSGPNLSIELRNSMNLLGSELNIMLNHWIVHINAEYDPIGRESAIVFVDQDGDFNNHRFCSTGKSPFDSAATWFNPMRGSNLINEAAFYAGINTATCESEAGDHTQNLYTCAVAKTLQSNANTDLTRFVPFASIAKIFHPTVQGHTATQKAVKRKMEFNPSKSISQKLRILAMGDSNTYGSQHSLLTGGYRQYLDTLLKGAIFLPNTNEFVAPKYIGTQESPTGSKLFHEGYSGIQTRGLLDKILTLPTMNKYPNVILLLIGTNNIVLNSGFEVMKTDLKAMMAELLRATDQKALILVGGLMPMGDTTVNVFPQNSWQKLAHQYNAYAKGLVNAYRALGVNVAYVHPAVDQEWSRRDNLHPNPVGWEKMAHAWFEAIVDAHKLGMIPTIQFWERNEVGGTKVACPVKPTWEGKGLVHSGKGNDIAPEVICRDATPPVGTNGGCTCTDGINPAYTIPRQNNNVCTDHNYRNIHAVQFADLDGDGKADYIHVGSNGMIRADRNMAVGTVIGAWSDAGIIFTPAAGAVVRKHEVRFADINGDGRADMLWVYSDGGVRGFWNKGSIAGDNPVKVQFQDVGMIAGFGAGGGPPGSRVTFADINGDGRADYVWLEDDGGAFFYLNTGPIAGTDSQGIIVGWTLQTQTATGINGQGTRWRTRFNDLNGDGRADFLWMKPDGSTDLWNNGAIVSGGTAGMRAWIEMGQVATGVGNPKRVAFDIMFADLDGNGKDDYIYVNPDTGAASVWMNYCIH